MAETLHEYLPRILQATDRRRRPRLEPEFEVARALIEAALSERVGKPNADQVAASMWELLEQRMAGRPQAVRMSQLERQMREIAAGSSVTDTLLGYERRRIWFPGAAGLDQRECEVVKLAMEGWAPEAIQSAMRPTRTGERPSLESVYVWRSRGQRKLRELFKMQPEQEFVVC